MCAHPVFSLPRAVPSNMIRGVETTSGELIRKRHLSVRDGVLALLQSSTQLNRNVFMDIDVEFLSGVKGFLDDEEGRALYQFALAAGRLGPCLEVGSYCGKSAIYLGVACRVNGSILFSIDHHRGSEEQQPGEEYFDPDLYDPAVWQVDTFGEFRKNVEAAGLEDTVVPVVCRSEVAARSWQTPLGLVFIDGGHSYAAAFADYTAWSGHIMPEGYLLIHDIFTDPEKGGQAPYQVYQLALESGRFRELPMIKTLGVLQKR